MLKENNKINIFVPLIIAVIICIVLCWLSSKFEIGNYISIIGSIASLYGLWLAYKQIKSVKEISKETNDAVNSKIVQLNNHLTMADMSRILTLANEIHVYLSSSKTDQALLRMRDLKSEIVQLRQNKLVFESEDDLESINDCVKTLGIDIVNLDNTSRKGYDISLETVTSNMENLSTVISDIEGKLKYKEYDKSN